MTELKPCPFCGGSDIRIEKIYDYHEVSCCDCLSRTEEYPTKEEAIEAWNKRPNPWHVGIPTEDGDYIVCMSDSLSTPMHVPCTVRNGKPFISMVYDTKLRTIRAYMPFKPYIR